MISPSVELMLKRVIAAKRIKEIAPHVETLVDMLDETKVDLILIALAGATLDIPGDKK